MCIRDRNSVALLEQLRTIDKRRLRDKLGSFDKSVMLKIDAAIAISVGID